MFKKLHITDHFTFKELAESVTFEDVCKGRKAAVVVDCLEKQDGSISVPIVRTTTSYKRPAHKLPPKYRALFDSVAEHNKKGTTFNNAMVELYDTTYRTMSFHTDQAQDLQPNSFICLYSCYEHPPEFGDLRILRVRKKHTSLNDRQKDDPSHYEDIFLSEGLCVIFSKEWNAHYVHQIILNPETTNHTSKNRWLGVTMRLSSTWVTFEKDSDVCVIDKERLCLANTEQRKAIYAAKKMENETNGPYQYDEKILKHVTLSQSDLLKPI